jgi:phosphoglycolate phosphatase
MTYLLFDLDGTISDPLDGIGNSINYALESLSFKKHSLSDLSSYIGPPLDETFKILTGLKNDLLISQLIVKYRERYGQIGYSENSLYPGIKSAIHTLKKYGFNLGICTSKRSDFADKILRMFEIRDHCEFISGGDIGIHKSQQIESLLKDRIITSNALMIGDRGIDIIAAKKNNVGSIGVLWGYGSRTELESESPLLILKKTEELKELEKFLVK